MTEPRAFSDLSTFAKEAMQELGNAGPTVRTEAREVKGHKIDDDGGSSKRYWHSNELRSLAQGLIEVADWLDERAVTAGEEPKR